MLYGTVEFRGSGGLQFTNPEYEIVRGEPGEDETTRRCTPAASSRSTRRPDRSRRGCSARSCISCWPICRPTCRIRCRRVVRETQALPDRRQALTDTHFPPAGTDVEALNAFRTPAQRRLIFEEFFLFQAGLALRKRRQRRGAEGAAGRRRRSDSRVGAPGAAVHADRRAEDGAEGDRHRHAAARADEPAAAGRRRRRQDDRRAARGARRDGERPAGGVHGADGNPRRPALPDDPPAARAVAIPRRVAPAGSGRRGGATSSRRSASGAAHLVVGTHALAEEAVQFHELGLVVIDEQHRFGVVQRATLRAKGVQPDVLVMTATPIPRTLALTAYGDLDVSVIRELPPGRQPIRTIAQPESRREEVYRLARQELEPGPAGLRHLSARRGLGQGRSARGDGDGRAPAGGGVSGVHASRCCTAG